MNRFLWKALRHSVRLHLLIPLVIFVVSEVIFTLLTEPAG